MQSLPENDSDMDEAREDKTAEDKGEEDVPMRSDEEHASPPQEEVGEELGDDSSESSDEEVVVKVPAKRKGKDKARVRGEE